MPLPFLFHSVLSLPCSLFSLGFHLLPHDQQVHEQEHWEQIRLGEQCCDEQQEVMRWALWL